MLNKHSTNCASYSSSPRILTFFFIVTLKIIMGHRCEHASVQVWKLENNIQEQILSFHPRGSGDETRVIRMMLSTLSTEASPDPSLMTSNRVLRSGGNVRDMDFEYLRFNI